ncbi:lysozyme inhibitor LprI family protein, partial [Pseudomonadota bacterium]
MIKFAILFLLSFIPMQFVFAASFDCNKASTKVEKLICSDTEISKLDEELSKAYSGALKKSSDEQSFKRGQRDWLIERNTCSNIECLKRKYIQRTNLLKTIFGCSEKNIISELPKEVQELVPLDMGIEAIERVTEPNTDIKLIAAIADPIWSFDYCGGDMPEHDSDARVLLVWREKAGEWKQVGKSEKVLYSITTGGVSNVRLIANVDVFEVSNSQHRSGQMLWSGYDNYRFEYDLSSDSIQIINWQSSSYNYELNFFIDESQQK